MATRTYTLTFSMPFGEHRFIVDTLSLRADAALDMSKSVTGAVSPWARFESHLQTRHRKTFDARVDPITNQRWTPVLPEYAKRKPAGKRNKTLEFSGTLRKALTSPPGKKARGAIRRRMKLALEWGVGNLGVYPLAHQNPVKRPTRKDGKSLKRGHLGMKLPDDMLTLAKIIRTESIAIARFVMQRGR